MVQRLFTVALTSSMTLGMGRDSTESNQQRGKRESGENTV